MTITPDTVVFWNNGFIQINATLVFTWLVMLLLVAGSIFATRHFDDQVKMTPWQNLLEVLVTGLQNQIREVSRQEPGHYLPFVGTLFIFIFTANLLSIVPGYLPPTASLSTSVALAICVFFAVPFFGITNQGLKGYLRQYTQPTVFMLPFNLVSELSRTLALAVRLYGNMMSGMVIVAILLGIVPLFFPVLMQLLGMLTGAIQAYIFAVLAMVYIASATRARNNNNQSNRPTDGRNLSFGDKT